MNHQPSYTENTYLIVEPGNITFKADRSVLYGFNFSKNKSEATFIMPTNFKELETKWLNETLNTEIYNKIDGWSTDKSTQSYKNLLYSNFLHTVNFDKVTVAVTRENINDVYNIKDIWSCTKEICINNKYECRARPDILTTLAKGFRPGNCEFLDDKIHPNEFWRVNLLHIKSKIPITIIGEDDYNISIYKNTSDNVTPSYFLNDLYVLYDELKVVKV